MSLKSINPYTNDLIRETKELSDGEAESICREVSEEFESWKRTSFTDRGRFMRQVASGLRTNAGEYAADITAEMGKPVKEALAEVEKCAWVCDYYADNAVGFLKDKQIETDAWKSYIHYEPLGTILGIMPWNFPFWQVFRFAVPAIMAGNTALLKHASNVQISASNIEKIFSAAGFPEAVFRNLAIGSPKVEKIIRNENVMAVSLTGSGPAGEKVAGIAGEVLKKCVLELGGSNAFIVLADADIEKAAETAVQARFQNAGQSCIAAKRFIIDKNVLEEFLTSFTERVMRIRTGDPSDPRTEMGPLSGIEQAETIEDQVNRSAIMGAKILLGGKRDNAFYSPTIITDVVPGMPLFDEEVFGPVAPITSAEDEQDAVRLAGMTDFGLGVSLFTNDMEKAEKLARKFHDGAVFINGLVKSDPRLPFGGTRRSGFGRELSFHGIREFVNIKTVWIKKF